MTRLFWCESCFQKKEHRGIESNHPMILMRTILSHQKTKRKSSWCTVLHVRTFHRYGLRTVLLVRTPSPTGQNTRPLRNTIGNSKHHMTVPRKHTFCHSHLFTVCGWATIRQNLSSLPPNTIVVVFNLYTKTLSMERIRLWKCVMNLNPNPNDNDVF